LPTRRQFLFAGGAAVAGGIALGIDGHFECDRIQLKRVEIPLSHLPAAFDGFRIAQLSDFHYDDFSASPIRNCVQTVNNLNPDVVALTGDFVTVSLFTLGHKPHRRASRAAEPCAEVLAGLKARLGSFAVLGNHDAGADPHFITSALQVRGIKVLRNASLPIEKDGSRIWIAGVADALEAQPDLNAAIGKIPGGETTILLAHEPDFADRAAFHPVDLQLSGHSHGGQIWIPGIGAPWLPPLARRYPRGLYRIRDLTLYTNIGIGTIRAPVRINCVPEVTLITLRTTGRS
jgi:predicted MPP superfamily phosphohydrolase